MRTSHTVLASIAGSVLSLLACLPADAQGQTPAAAPLGTTLENAQNTCLFRWAEDRFPAYFRSVLPATQSAAAFTFRYYEKTDTYLAIKSSDNHLYFYNPAAGNVGLHDLGPVSAWVEQSGCRAPYEPVTTPWDDVAVAPMCNPANPAQNCLETHPRAIRVDDELRFNFVRADFDSTTSTLRAELKDGATLDPRFEVGTYLYRGRKDKAPLLHRVDAVQQSGQMVSMTMTKVSAKDVFPRGRIRARLPLAESVASASRSLRESPSAVEVGIGPRDCSGKVFDGKATYMVAPDGTPTYAGKSTLDLTSCRFRLTAWVDTILEWDTVAINVDKLEVTVGGSVDASLHSTLTLDLQGGASDSKKIWDWPDIPFNVAGILITISPTLYAGYDLTGRANLVSQQGFDLTDSIEVGFGYSDVNDWYSIDNRSSSFSKYGPTINFDGNVTATAWVKPELGLKAFGFVGGTIALKGFAEARVTSTATVSGGNYSGSLCTSLDLGLTPSVGAVAELAGITLFSEDVALATFRTHVVQNQCQPYTGPTPSDADLSSNCFTDGQCPQPGDVTLTATCEKGASTGNGKYFYSCKTNIPANYCLPGNASLGDAKCIDGNRFTRDYCDTNTHRCVNTANNAEEAAAALITSGTSPAANADALCRSPACCFSNADCNDGNLATKNVCQKPGVLKLPDVQGTCVIDSVIPEVGRII